MLFQHALKAFQKRGFSFLIFFLRLIKQHGVSVAIRWLATYDVSSLSLGKTGSLRAQLTDSSSMHYDKNNSTYVAYDEKRIDAEKCPVKTIAFYLPQYHPIPENDLWWGKGFTEWTNVTKALPQFDGHYQPHLPGEFGFYDLRLKDVQKKQIDLARNYGITGFCYYYYWFDGKRLLEKPLDNILKDKSLDFPFCICWANENWTRRWDGLENELLMKQSYSMEFALAFIRDIEHILKDPRYIRVNGRPLLIIYRILLLPDPVRTVDCWRQYCRDCGIGEIHLVAAMTYDLKDPCIYGFDAGVEFPPHQHLSMKIHKPLLRLFNPEFKGSTRCYSSTVTSEIVLRKYSFPCYRTVFPSWDNTARKPNDGTIFHGSNTKLYKNWLNHAFDSALDIKKTTKSSDGFVFINAWNEWAEGAHLEPDRKYGYAWLNTTADVIENYSKIME